MTYTILQWLKGRAGGRYKRTGLEFDDYHQAERAGCEAFAATGAMHIPMTLEQAASKGPLP